MSKHLSQSQLVDELARLTRFKSRPAEQTSSLGEEMVNFYHQSVQKRQTKLGEISVCWGQLVPEILNDHCALESLYRGKLTVVVDDAAHLYELKQLLLAGLEKQLLLACRKSGLRKISLKQGRWYESSTDGRRPTF